MDEGEKLRSSGNQRSDQFLLEPGHPQPDEIDGIRRWFVPGERLHRREGTEFGESLLIVVQESGQTPSSPCVRMMPGPDVKFAAEPAGPYDEQLFHR